ncbi:MAG: hypothetical protein JXA60_11320 [Candidatus Coatesbacteria bacterium]|nr:hypothetical protein [Candidatus Coatesbacteria bacterium]
MKKIALLTMFILTFSSLSAFRKCNAHEEKGIMKFFFKIENISEEQKIKIHEQHMKFIEQEFQLKKQRMDLNFKMMLEKTRKDPDYNKIAQYLKEIDETSKKHRELKKSFYKEIYEKILTKEQLEKIKKSRINMKGKNKHKYRNK